MDECLSGDNSGDDFQFNEHDNNQILNNKIPVELPKDLLLDYNINILNSKGLGENVDIDNEKDKIFVNYFYQQPNKRTYLELNKDAKKKLILFQRKD